MQGSTFGYNVLKILWKPTHEHFQPYVTFTGLAWVSTQLCDIYCLV